MMHPLLDSGLRGSRILCSQRLVPIPREIGVAAALVAPGRIRLEMNIKITSAQQGMVTHNHLRTPHYLGIRSQRLTICENPNPNPNVSIIGGLFISLTNYILILWFTSSYHKISYMVLQRKTVFFS